MGPVTTVVPVVVLFVLAGVALVAGAGWALSRLLASRWSGSLVGADDGRSGNPDLCSDEYGLMGRPDEVWQLRDGTLIPVELKSRAAPASGVLPSHRVQVEAYCLLIESTTGRSPPYGVLVYAGGVRRTVRWDGWARQEVIRLLAEVRGPYDGRAAPTVAKCRGCRWRTDCDVRAG
jgi:CRISPR/Cas system-associated exonuclease Cas4 (RecB family)